mgnify:CR=1 FL=1
MQKLQICVYVALGQYFNPILRGILSDDINRGEVSGGLRPFQGARACGSRRGAMSKAFCVLEVIVSSFNSQFSIFNSQFSNVASM